MNDYFWFIPTNMKHTILLLLITISAHLSFSQTSYKISSYNPTDRVFKNLLLSNAEIAANDTMNEEVLDLVKPLVLDSILGRKKEHHQLFLVGWLIHAFGDYNWRAVSMVKEKYVGTVRSNSRSSEEQFTEYDINFDLMFHLKKYLWHVFDSYDIQKGYHKQDFRRGKHLTNYSKDPFERDTNNIDIKRYRLHCEMTPPPPFRVQLHYLFFPTQPGLALKDHPNFGTDHPSMGFYGSNCVDCNHNCHPELHPYEWAWWLNLHGGDPSAKTWLVGLFYEGSNRFRHWSRAPKVGKISIPFAYTVKDNNVTPSVMIDHLVFNKFLDDDLNKLPITDSTFDAKIENRVIYVVGGNGVKYGININFKGVLPTAGLKYWLSDINWDDKNHILSGYFNFATAVKELYTTRITFKN